MGTWITNIATSWLVYRLTGSAVLLGIVSFTSQFPAFLISPLAGVHVDRMNRKKVLLVTQALSALQSLALGLFTMTGYISVPILLTLGIFQALVDGFYIPARQAFISELLSHRSDLANAIALNSASFHLARLIGPAIGGLLIAYFGEGPCFLVDAVSYCAVLISLFTVQIDHIEPPQFRRSILDELYEGILYIKNTPKVRMLLAHMAFICLIGISHSVLLPVLVRDVYFKGADYLGFLMGASGFGALIGALTLATQTSVAKLIPRIQRSSFYFAISITLLALSPNYTASVFILALCGFFFINVGASSNTVIQTAVEDKFRGRVMSFFAMTFTGMMPLGAVASGYLANRIGVQSTIGICGVLCFFGGTALLLTNRNLRDLYRSN